MVDLPDEKSSFDPVAALAQNKRNALIIAAASSDEVSAEKRRLVGANGVTLCSCLSPGGFQNGGTNCYNCENGVSGCCSAMAECYAGNFPINYWDCGCRGCSEYSCGFLNIFKCKSCNSNYLCADFNWWNRYCVCAGGTGSQGSNCPGSNQNHCSSCFDGYDGPDALDSCTVKQCTCDGGTAAIGVDCPTTGDEKCVGCNVDREYKPNTNLGECWTTTTTTTTECTSENWDGNWCGTPTGLEWLSNSYLSKPDSVNAAGGYFAFDWGYLSAYRAPENCFQEECLDR